MVDDLLPDRVRDACARVMERPRWARVEHAALPRYACRFQHLTPSEGANAGNDHAERGEAAAAWAICMNAINFGSGWWPTIRKRPGRSGYATMAAGVAERFAERGHWSAEELAAMETKAIAAVVGQDPEHPLMAQFAAALRDAGDHLLAEHGGRFLGPVGAADSIPALADTFAAWEAFADTSRYEDRDVPFFKRAQLTAADLHRAGVATLPGLERLTAFADNLVPHVLRVDGVLVLDPELEQAIESEQLLPHGSPQEVELRAAAVHAVEQLATATGGALPPCEIDGILWNRGRGRRYKSLPRPRCRTTAY